MKGGSGRAKTPEQSLERTDERGRAHEEAGRRGGGETGGGTERRTKGKPQENTRGQAGVGAARGGSRGRGCDRPPAPHEDGFARRNSGLDARSKRAPTGGDAAAVAAQGADELPDPDYVPIRLSAWTRLRTGRGRRRKTLSRQTCSRTFRDRIARTYPGLGVDPAYWEFTELLLFGKELTRDRELLLPHATLASLCGYSADTGNFKSGAFLEAFRRDVCSRFAWSEHDYYNERVRAVVADGFEPGIHEALALELASNPAHVSDRVYFATGFAFDAKRDPKQLREMDRSEAEHYGHGALTDDQRFVRDYLNGLHPRSFSFMKGNIDTAYATARAIEGEPARTQALKLLHRVHVQPVPYYHAVSNSYRLFAGGAGLQQIHRAVREAAMAGCWDLDADALHLAIMARAWSIPELQDFLETHGAAAVWRSLTSHVAREIHGRDSEARPLAETEHDAYKAAIKHGVYALGYGGGRAKVAEQIESHDTRAIFTDYEAVVEALGSHELLGAVFEAKDRMLRRILRDGGMVGAYGEWVRLKKGRNPLSVLAMASSSYEMALMRTVFDMASEHAAYCTILLYQFDGVTVRFRREADAGWIIEKVQTAFSEKATALGIATQLSSEALGASRAVTRNSGVGAIS